MLVLDDSGFSAEGFNHYVIDQTQDYVNSHTANVFPFTVLDIDTFILIAELLKNNEIDLFSEIENYHSYISGSYDYASVEERYYATNSSFAAFLKSRYETKSPAIIGEWIRSL